MSDLLGQRAVVVGGGIGGLAIAGTLAKYFECIEIFEHDRLKALPPSRSGTPGSAPHGRLADGAVRARVAQDMQYERPKVGVLPKRDFGLSLLRIETADRAGAATSSRADRKAAA